MKLYTLKGANGSLPGLILPSRDRKEADTNLVPPAGGSGTSSAAINSTHSGYR